MALKFLVRGVLASWFHICQRHHLVERGFSLTAFSWATTNVFIGANQLLGRLSSETFPISVASRAAVAVTIVAKVMQRQINKVKDNCKMNDYKRSDGVLELNVGNGVFYTRIDAYNHSLCLRHPRRNPGPR
jgi:hypothetical protein